MHAQADFARDPSVHTALESSPMLRTWGLELVVRVMYFNHGLASGKLASREQSCIVEVPRSPSTACVFSIITLGASLSGHVHSASLFSVTNVRWPVIVVWCDHSCLHAHAISRVHIVHVQ